MSAGPQLERSVLEQKDREELTTIAKALGLKPSTRSKKETVIDEILGAAGVGSATDASSEGSTATKSTADKSATAKDAGSGGTDASDTSGEKSPGSSSETRTDSREGRSERYPRGGDRDSRGGGRDRGRGRGGDRGDSRGGGRERGRSREPRPEPVYEGEPIPVTGLLDLRDEGFGFLRTNGYLPSRDDVYVSISMVRKFGLRKGDAIDGSSRPASNNEKYPALINIDKVCGLEPEEARTRKRFEDLTPLFPEERLKLEMPGDGDMTGRIVDLISPIGKGQRGLIVSPPKAGKTTVLKHIAHAIEENNPDVHLMVLLVDERPEEVTDMRRHVKGEVIASTFDRPSEEHCQVAELSIDRAKRLVELGGDVVIILDGITRLARAYNLAAPASGRILSGGVDSAALYPPKRFFGAARNIEGGGSLTIVATALVDTGSKMDEVIFEEFKGTGNMELRLDRKLAERRLYPAIDVNASSTRHEELLFDKTALNTVWKLRRVLNALAQDGSAAAGLELMIDKLKSTKTNDEFLADINKSQMPAGV